MKSFDIAGKTTSGKVVRGTYTAASEKLAIIIFELEKNAVAYVATEIKK